MPCTKYKYLVLDIDDCSFTSEVKDSQRRYEANSNPYLLSEDLIKLAKSGGYQGVYFCTHRAYLDIRNSGGVIVQNYNYTKKFRTEQKLAGELNIENYYTHKIVENFAKETHLPIIKISTRDDLILNGSCGSGYEKVLRPAEEKMLQSGHMLSPQDAKSFDDKKNHLPTEELRKLRGTKIPQLVQVCDDAIAYSQKIEEAKCLPAEKKFPIEVELHYFDDHKDLVENAVNNFIAKENVVFRAFHHYPAEGICCQEIFPQRAVIASRSVTSTATIKTKTDALSKSSTLVPSAPRHQSMAEVQISSRPMAANKERRVYALGRR